MSYLELRKDTHISPWWASYGMFILGWASYGMFILGIFFLENWPCCNRITLCILHYVSCKKDVTSFMKHSNYLYISQSTTWPSKWDEGIIDIPCSEALMKLVIKQNIMLISNFVIWNSTLSISHPLMSIQHQTWYQIYFMVMQLWWSLWLFNLSVAEIRIFREI